jgi:hypothetical protein
LFSAFSFKSKNRKEVLQKQQQQQQQQLTCVLFPLTTEFRAYGIVVVVVVLMARESFIEI